MSDKRVTVKLDIELHRALTKAAASKKLSLHSYILLLFQNSVNEEQDAV